MSKTNTKTLLSNLIVAMFLLLVLARDIVGANVPLIALSFVWCAGLLIWDDDQRVAFTVAATICFASSVSITIPIFVFLIIFLFKYKKVYLNTILCISLLVLIIEASKFIQFNNQDFKLFVNYMMLILLVSFVISFHYIDGCFDVVLILKYYLFFFCFLSLDILFLTIKNYGSFASILGSSFRIGQTDFVEGQATTSMSINANGVGLLAILSVLVAYLLLKNKYLNKTTAYVLILYSSLIGFLTVSKTFFVVYIIMILFLVIEDAKTNFRNPFKTMGLITIIIVAFLFFQNTDLYTNIMLRFASGDFTTGRVDIFQQYLNYMSEHSEYQLLGVGLQNVNYKVGISNVPHNAVLEVYVTLGIIGLILYFVMFFSIFRWSKNINIEKYSRKTPFLNMIPIFIYLIFIQALQFLRISYIYVSLVIVAMALVLPPQSIQDSYEDKGI